MNAINSENTSIKMLYSFESPTIGTSNLSKQHFEMYRVLYSYNKVKLVFFMIFLSKSTLSQGPPCDPFEIGTNPEKLQTAVKNGEENPNDCLCTFPCTTDKVDQFVRFYYIKRGERSYSELDVSNPSASRLFNYEGELKFLFHGYIEKATVGWMPPMAMQLTKTFKGYVLLVDYGPISNCSFERSVKEIIPSVALYVANMISVFRLNPSKIELIGHSLGAHAAGYVGASFNGAIKRITALDPAGPGFDENNIGLNQTCAQFVQVLHTSPGLLGTTLLRGDVDFFANNRSQIQPGCTTELCTHVKSVYYYFGSLFPKNKFTGGDCRLFDVTHSSYTSQFGRFNDGKAGSFCFDTTPCFPYARTIELKCRDTNCKDSNKCKNSKCKH